MKSPYVVAEKPNFKIGESIAVKEQNIKWRKIGLYRKNRAKRVRADS